MARGMEFVYEREGYEYQEDHCIGCRSLACRTSGAGWLQQQLEQLCFERFCERKWFVCLRKCFGVR